MSYRDGDAPETDEELYRFIDFQNEKSALRRATKSNPRCYPCPTCGKPNMLTAKDKALGYQCDECADRAEGGGY